MVVSAKDDETGRTVRALREGATSEGRANIAVVCFRAEFSANVIFEHSSEVENGVRSTCLRANPPSSFPADSISLYVPLVPAV